VKPILLINIEHFEGVYEIFTVNKFVYLLSFSISEEYDILYDILVEVVVSFLLSSMTLVIIITPLVLIYCWVYYSWRYVIKFKRNKDLRQILIEKDHIDLNKLPKSKWPEYRRIYSKMIGFAVAIIAYAISSNVYMLKNFNEIKVALKEYFSFPFKVFKGLNTVDEASKYTIPLKEVWFGMFLIVGISILVFFIVYFITKTALNAKFNRRESNSIQPIRN
jgi:hypothetical protein